MSKTKGFLLAVAAAVMAFTFSCSSEEDTPNVIEGPTVGYGGETYQTVVIGTQTWFVRNLNYDVSGSKCYDNEPANCSIYGRLYDWETAQTVCPSGWHLPSQADWNVMTAYIGGADTEGRKLKATSGWNDNGNGKDTYGFSTLPGGYGGSDGSFYYVGYSGRWWSSTEYDASYAYRRRMIYYGEYANWVNIDKSYLFSVRCVKD